MRRGWIAVNRRNLDRKGQVTQPTQKASTKAEGRERVPARGVIAEEESAEPSVSQSDGRRLLQPLTDSRQSPRARGGAFGMKKRGRNVG